ncbi:MAG: hypothetical protein L3K19_05045 [Thermoplasmata archaeon]|nr:hypothetical protein [Thermoplasmata archaeon]
MEWAELVRSVTRFGLTEREATMYLTLLRRGRATARELAREAQIDRVLGYRMLDALRARGIVEVTAQRPRRYAAAPPKAMFERTLRERRGALEQDESLARELAESLPALANQANSQAPRFQVLSGAQTLYDYLREMMGRAEADLSVMVTQRGLRESFGVGLHNWLPRFLNTGGRFRLVVESDPRIRPLLKRFEPVARRFPSAQVRQRWPQPTRLTIIDEAEALLFLVPEARSGQIEETAVWTDNSDFVRGQLGFFDSVWAGAGSMSLKSPPKHSRAGRRRKV